MSNWPIIKPLLALLFSRKFWVLLVSALTASGISWAQGLEAWIPLILLSGGTVFAMLTAYEDAAAKGNGRYPGPPYG